MEADAKHNFQSTENDELSFQKGDVLKVLNLDDRDWYKAELNGIEGLIPSNYISMKANRWFIADITRSDSEILLLEKDPQGDYYQKDGAFLVRPSENSPGEFSLSVKFGQTVQHFKVLRDGAGKYFLWVVKFDSLNKLVKYHKTSSVSRSQTIYLQEMWRPKVVAKFDFQAQQPDEMSINRGDMVDVVHKKDRDWWLGEMQRQGKTIRGYFPVTYVELID